VQKYGGSSLETPEQIKAIATEIAKLHELGHRLIIVVSAMGKTTDQLVELAYSLSQSPNRRELDMLLTTGERVSMSLMSMALNDLGCRAISFTGSQAGVLTDELHSNARIIDIKPVRIESELKNGTVIVLAGFQGVSPATKEITTLGRGGSDTTAVAMAAHFGAERCEIRKDVDGVHSADPRLVKNTHHLDSLDYASLLDMTFWGAKVLHYRSVELGALLNIPLLIGLAHGSGQQTLIKGFSMNKSMNNSMNNSMNKSMIKNEISNSSFESARVLSVNSHKDVRWIEIKEKEFAPALSMLSSALRGETLPLPQILDSDRRGDTVALLVTAPIETLGAIERVCKAKPEFVFDPTALATVTATCQGAFASPLAEEISKELKKDGIEVAKLIFGAMSITAVVASADRDEGVRALHRLVEA
jgi:aspartate kinase